jgi:hypothetical protein
LSQIICNVGQTQIEKILIHAKKETKLLRVSALIFVGDAMEENPDVVVHEAGELGRLGVPAFMLHEGCDPWLSRRSGILREKPVALITASIPALPGNSASC